LMSYVEGVSGKRRVIRDSTRGTITINYFNESIANFCRLAIDNVVTPINLKRLVLESEDKDKITWSHQSYRSEWKRENTYTYTVTLPLQLSEQQRNQFIRKDISRWLETIFNLEVFKEKKQIDCLCLVKNSHGE